MVADRQVRKDLPYEKRRTDRPDDERRTDLPDEERRTGLPDEDADMPRSSVTGGRLSRPAKISRHGEGSQRTGLTAEHRHNSASMSSRATTTRGTRAVTVVPRPAAVLTVKRPPSSSARSRMVRSP